MEDKKLKSIHTACGIMISAAIAVAAVCLIISAYTIYSTGDAPYTPESVGEQYARFALPLWITVGAVAAGILIDVFLPSPKKVKKNHTNALIRLAIMQKKLSMRTCASGIMQEIEKERRLRRIFKAVCALLCAVAFIPSVIILCDFEAYTVEDLTPAILRTVMMLCLGAALSAVFMSILSILESKSAEREIAKTKIALSEGEKKEDTKTEDACERGMALLRLILVGAACLLIFLGSLDNGFYDVLQKAIRICTECIGLG